MKFVIFSDIHGNAGSLEAFLDRAVIHTEDIVIFCGDTAGYYYDVDKCIELMSSITNLTAVRGNHDQYYIDAFHDERLTKQLVKKYGVSYQVKSERAYAFFKELPLQRTISRNGYRIWIQHGSPEDPLEGRVYPDTELPEEPEQQEMAVYICGHTHYRMYRKKGSGIWINPGALGQPRDGKGFSYCVFDAENMEVEFYTLSIDTASLMLKIERNDPGNSYLKKVLNRNRRNQ